MPDTPEPLARMFRISAQADADFHGTTFDSTFEDFAAANADDTELLYRVSVMAVGASIEVGGGASPLVSITRLPDALPVADTEPPNPLGLPMPVAPRAPAHLAAGDTLAIEEMHGEDAEGTGVICCDDQEYAEINGDESPIVATVAALGVGQHIVTADGGPWELNRITRIGVRS